MLLIKEGKDEEVKKQRKILDKLLNIPGIYLNGDRKNRLPNNINM